MGGRVAAAEANHHELPRRCADQEAAAGAGQCGEKADDEGAGILTSIVPQGNISRMLFETTPKTNSARRRQARSPA